MFSDGSLENTCVMDSHVVDVRDKLPQNTDHFYHDNGDGSVEDGYHQGYKSSVPVSSFGAESIASASFKWRFAGESEFLIDQER